MNKAWLTIQQLDRQLKEWQLISNKYSKPRQGWVKAIRAALKMSGQQLADRLGLTRIHIAQLEKAEVQDALTLRTLKETANALDCDFVYAFVPKSHASLKEIVEARALAVARERVNRVAHSMSLEGQSLKKDFLKKQQEALAKELTEKLDKEIWQFLDKDYIKQKQKKIN